MKKLAVVLGALIALLIITVMAIPLFVNVDKYRPVITSAVNQRLDGSLELGELSLSLWGQLRVEVAGLSLKDSGGHNVVSVKSAYFHVPFFSLLSGSPVIELNMDSPVVNVVKNHAGKLNVMTLLKAVASPNATQAASSGATPGVSPSAQALAVPAIAANARLGLALNDATIDYIDETQGLTTQLKDLNIVAKNLSLTHPSEISVWSDLDTKMDSLSIRGPARVDLQFSPFVGGGKLIEFALEGKADFGKLEISLPGTFEKKSGVPANIELALKGSTTGSTQEVAIEKADIEFFNVHIKSSGSVTGLPSKPLVHYTLTSNDIDLKSWTELLPMLSQYELGGKASLAASVGGESSKLSYQARIGVEGLTAKAPMLRSQPRIDGQIVIATDQIQKLDVTMTAPGNQLRISGKVLSFTAPQASFEVTSSGMDLDRLVDFKALQASKKTESTAAFVPSAYAERVEKSPADFDALLDPIRESGMLAKTTANVSVNIRSLEAENVKMTDLAGQLSFKDLGVGLEKFGMKVFGGSVQANVACQLRSRQPTYKFSTTVKGLDLGQAMQSQMAMFKNTATGTAGFEIAGEGSSFNPELAESRLKAKGALRLTNAELTTIDIGKMASEGLASALSKAKIPGLQGKSLTSPHEASKYQIISSDFGISNGKFIAPNLVGKAVPNQGIDFKANAQIGLQNKSLNAKMQITDTYNLLHAKEFQGGILCERGKPFVLPVGVGCTLQSPCYSYGDSAAFLARIAMNNMVGQVKSQVQSQVQSQIQKALDGSGSPNIGKALKGLFGN